MRKQFAVHFFTCFLVFAPLYVMADQEKVEISSPRLATYINEVNGYSIEYPIDWINSNSEFDAAAAELSDADIVTNSFSIGLCLFEPMENDPSLAKANMNIVSLKLEQSETLENYAKAVSAFALDQHVQADEVLINGVVCKRLCYIWSIAGTDPQVNILQFIIDVKDSQHILTFGARDFEVLLPFFDKIAASFRLLP